MPKTTAETNQDLAYQLSNNLSRLLREFAKDFEVRILDNLHERGHTEIRPSHSSVFANLGLGAVRVTELAERARVTQQAMGKMLKELERIGYIARDIDQGDKRAKEIRLTDKGVQLVADSMEAIKDVEAEYAAKVGVRRLKELEKLLADTVDRIELDYLPESWVRS